MLTFIRYVEVYSTFAFLDCVRYNEDFVKSRFCSILTRLNKIVQLYRGLRYIEVRLNRGSTTYTFFIRLQHKSGTTKRFTFYISPDNLFCCLKDLNLPVFGQLSCLNKF